MARMEWFRWYNGTCEDTKLRMVSRYACVTLRNVTSNGTITLRDVIAVWAMVMESASQGPGDGKLKYQSDYIAVHLDFSDEEMDAIWKAMERVGLIKTDPAFTYVTNWNKRQYLTDRHDPTNKDRQRRWREKQVSADTPTNCVTLHNVSRNGAVTAAKRPDTDTDTDVEEEKERYTATQPIIDKPNAIYARGLKKIILNGNGISVAGVYSDQQKRDDFALNAIVPLLPVSDGEKWAIAMAAEDQSHQNHQSAVRMMLKTAKAAGIGWVSPERRGKKLA